MYVSCDIHLPQLPGFAEVKVHFTCLWLVLAEREGQAGD